MVQHSGWKIGLFLISLTLMLAACGTAPAAPPAETGDTPISSEPALPTESSTQAQPTVEAPASEAPASEVPPTETPAEVPAFEGDTALAIVQEESEVRFIIGEILAGEPKTVVGVTNQVFGEMALNYAAPSDSQIGVVTVNADTLRTDNGNRNRALRNFILQTGQYPTVTFAPVSIEGLPDTVTFGQTYPVSITGILTIKSTSNEVTFEGSVTPVSETRLQGSASTVILYADYGMAIPSVPQVAGVDPNVRLEIDFVAAAR